MFHVDQRLEQFVAGGDNFGVGLKTTLGGDEIGHFGGEIDVGDFQIAGLNQAQIAGAGRAGGRLDGAGVGLVGIKIAALALEGLRVLKVLQHDLGAGEGGAVGKSDVDLALGIDGEGGDDGSGGGGDGRAGGIDLDGAEGGRAVVGSQHLLAA